MIVAVSRKAHLFIGAVPVGTVRKQAIERLFDDAVAFARLRFETFAIEHGDVTALVVDQPFRT